MDQRNGARLSVFSKLGIPYFLDVHRAVASQDVPPHDRALAPKLALVPSQLSGSPSKSIHPCKGNSNPLKATGEDPTDD